MAALGRRFNYKFSVEIGFALAKNGEWCAHSWIWDDDNERIIDHVYLSFDKYFGVGLPTTFLADQVSFEADIASGTVHHHGGLFIINLQVRMNEVLLSKETNAEEIPPPPDDDLSH